MRVSRSHGVRGSARVVALRPRRPMHLLRGLPACKTLPVRHGFFLCRPLAGFRHVQKSGTSLAFSSLVRKAMPMSNLAFPLIYCTLWNSSTSRQNSRTRQNKAPRQPHRRPRIESLEPRLFLAADLAESALDMWATSPPADPSNSLVVGVPTGEAANDTSGIAKDQSGQIGTQTIFGGDNRIQVTNTNSYPWSAVGRIEVTFPHESAPGRNDVNRYGSGAMIDSFHFLTAGHLLYDHDRGGWATSVKVSMGQKWQHKTVWRGVCDLYPHLQQLDQQLGFWV